MKENCDTRVMSQCLRYAFNAADWRSALVSDCGTSGNIFDIDRNPALDYTFFISQVAHFFPIFYRIICHTMSKILHLIF